MLQIFKFGGASVKDEFAVRNLSEIIKSNHSGQLIVIVSAMGKTTSKLEEIGRAEWNGGDGSKLLHDLLDFHDQIVDGLKITDTRKYDELKEGLVKEIKKKENGYGAFLDKIMSFGELMSTSIISSFLLKDFAIHWIDVRDHIITSSDFGEARVDWEQTKSRIRELGSRLEDSIIVTQGYIGKDKLGNTTTLGKEGSDFTGAIFASCLGADSLTVWKDVPGILNADPKLMEETYHYSNLSYQEITEMTYYGAKVIHPKTIVPLAKKNIPLYVKSFKDPSKIGTVIHQYESDRIQIPTYIFNFKQMVITLRNRNSSFMDEGKLISILSILDDHNIKLNLMQNSALTFTICIDENVEKLNMLKEKLSDSYVLTYNQGLHLATIINHSETAIKQLPEFKEKILEQVSRAVYQVLYHPN